MGNKQKTKDTNAIFIALLFLILGIIIAWLAKRYLSLEGEAIFISILLIPALVYLIFSGRITELKGPGGLEARFVGIAEQPVESSSETIESSVNEMEMILKGGISELTRQTGHLDESKPKKEMNSQNLEALVVVGSDRKLKGVVEREQLISKILLGFSK